MDRFQNIENFIEFNHPAVGVSIPNNVACVSPGMLSSTNVVPGLRAEACSEQYLRVVIFVSARVCEIRKVTDSTSPGGVTFLKKHTGWHAKTCNYKKKIKLN